MKRPYKAIKAIISWAVAALAIVMMLFTVVSVTTFDRGDRHIFGYRAYTVRSDSMSSVDGDETLGYFRAGDLILIREVDPTTLKAGDIITYISTDPDSYGETVTHKIKDTTLTADGQPGFITYGTATGQEDGYIVSYAQVLGQYQSRIPYVGRFFTFLRTAPGYLVCIFLPFLLLTLLRGMDSIRLFRQYRAQQTAQRREQQASELAALQAERQALAEERRRQEELLGQLRQF